MAKLKNARISDHMILGKTPADKRLMREVMAKNKEQLSTSRKNDRPATGRFAAVKNKDLSSSDFTLDRRPKLLPSPKPASSAPPKREAKSLAANKRQQKMVFSSDEEESLPEVAIPQVESSDEEESLPERRVLSGSR